MSSPFRKPGAGVLCAWKSPGWLASPAHSQVVEFSAEETAAGLSYSNWPLLKVVSLHGWHNPEAFNGKGGKAVLAGARTQPQLNAWLLCRGLSLGTMFQSCFSWFCPFHILLPSITGCLVPPSRFLKLFGSNNNHPSTRNGCIRDSQRTKPYNCLNPNKRLYVTYSRLHHRVLNSQPPTPN